jgi:hypothetical protein
MLLILASWVATITGMIHQHPAAITVLNNKFSCIICKLSPWLMSHQPKVLYCIFSTNWNILCKQYNENKI